MLKNNVFTFDKKKNLRGTAIGTSLYSILFMAELEILRKVQLNSRLCWRYTDDIFLNWEHGEGNPKGFIDALNKKHSTRNFPAQWSKK